MHDPNGKIRQDVENYVEKHPHASFDEVEKECFPNQDHTLKLFALSPRHFECAMAKTCQVLLEGEYDGVFQPGIHYIELKRDFSNLNQVVQQIKDTPTCEKIAERAYQDIVLSGNYTYRKFTETVADHVKALSKKKTDGAINQIMFRIVSGMLWVRKPFGPIHRFIMLPHPIYRLFRAVVPKPVRKKLKPLKNLLVNSR